MFDLAGIVLKFADKGAFSREKQLLVSAAQSLGAETLRGDR
jgi:hypothetical protein